MNITITVNGGSNSPDVQNLLQHLAKIIPGTIAVNNTPAEVISKKMKKVVEEKQSEVPVEEPTTEEVEAPKVEKEVASKHTAEAVRAAAIKLSKSGKREEVKTLIESYGVANLAGLTSEHFDSFMEKLEKL